MSRILLLGCGPVGVGRTQRVRVGERRVFDNTCLLTTVDNNPAHFPDKIIDLNYLDWPLESSFFDEVHAYEVLEHLGRQGDVGSFFNTFYEIWRVLKPGGILAATVPRWDSMWAWGDPSHTRVISLGSLVFLSQAEYKKQVGKTAMSDFRHMWKGNFEYVWSRDNGEIFEFKLRAVKS